MSPDRRKTDRLPVRIGAVCLLCTFVCVIVSFTTLHNRATLSDIQEGRRTGQQATCAAISAVIDAGRATITAGIPKPGAPLTPLERSLRRLGYPPRPVRRKQAQEAARAYGLQIAGAVARDTGRRGLVRPDGSLDCDRIAAATGIK